MANDLGKQWRNRQVIDERKYVLPHEGVLEFHTVLIAGGMLLHRALTFASHTASGMAPRDHLVTREITRGWPHTRTARSRLSATTAWLWEYLSEQMLWASVSEDVYKLLSAAAAQPLRLKPQEWKSGDTLWVILAVGDQRVVQGMLKGI